MCYRIETIRRNYVHENRRESGDGVRGVGSFFPPHDSSTFDIAPNNRLPSSHNRFGRRPRLLLPLRFLRFDVLFCFVLTPPSHLPPSPRRTRIQKIDGRISTPTSSRPRLPHVPQRRHQGPGRRGRADRIGIASVQARGQQERTPHGSPSQEILREFPGSQEEENRAGEVPRKDGEDERQAHEAAAHLSVEGARGGDRRGWFVR